MLEIRDEIGRLTQSAASPRVTLVRPGALGDTILLLPTAEGLQDAVPSAGLTVVGSLWAERILPLLPRPWEFVPFGSPQLTPLFSGAAAGAPPTAVAGADLLVLYASEPDGAFARAVRRLCPGHVITWPVDPPPGVHAACHFAAALTTEPPDEADLPAPTLRVRPQARGEAERWIAQRVGGANGRLVAVHPGSGGARKCWPAERFARLIEALGRRGARTVLLKGPADAQATQALVAHLTGAASLPVAGFDELERTAALVSCANAFVGNDSGLTHLAAALGVPTVAVFGPTDPALWRPLGRAVTVVQGAPTKDNPSAWPDLKSVLAAALAMLRPQ